MEFQSQARGQRVPESLGRRVAGVLAGQELAEVATITRTRCATRLLDEQGLLLAEVADDQPGARPRPLASGTPMEAIYPQVESLLTTTPTATSANPLVSAIVTT